jgi:hypothetical protein
MKKLLLLLLLSIFTFQVIAQETVHFNMHYKPETKYIAETAMSMDLITIHSGSDSYMKYFRETGMDSILKVNEFTRVKLELKVFNKDERGISPVEMKYISLETNGVENEFLSGLTAEGTIEGSDLPVMLTVKNSNFDSTFDSEFLLMMNQMFEQIKFPNVVLAVGESYEDSMPFVIPVGNTELNMKLNSVYTLKEIIDKRAFFELIQYGDIHFSESGMNFLGTYKGMGYAYYDLNYEIIDESNLEYSFETNYLSDYNNIQILLDGDYSQKFEFEKLN